MTPRCSSAIALGALALLAGAAAAPAQGVERYEPTWESLTRHATPEWFADAKFGIYWHWGIYSVPAYASEHYVRRMYYEPPLSEARGWQSRMRFSEYHRDHFGDPSEFGYKDFIPLFTAENFDAREWADLIVRSGARFAGPVGLHHDRFPMWDSDITEWNAANMGPRRDIVGELEQAIRDAAGLKFVVSLHHDRDWLFYDPSYEGDYDTQDPRYACTTCIYPEVHEPGTPPNEAHMQYWQDIVREVVDKYQPDLIWFDGALNDEEAWGSSLPRFREHLQEAIAYYYNRGLEWDRDVVMTYKHNDFEEGAGILDLERGRMDRLSPTVWLTDTSLTRLGWAYRQHADYKPANELIDVLVDIVSKNGNMLLNIAPRPDGTIPTEQQGLLLAIGEWLEMNGEAIYETRPWGIHGEGPTGHDGTAFVEHNEVVYTAEDIRFTTKGNVLYASVLDWPRGQATIRSLRGIDPSTIESISILGSDEEIRWEVGADGLVIHTPIWRPGDHAYVYRIEFRGQLPEPAGQ